MKILYLDCQMGAAGDMLASSILEVLGTDKETQKIYIDKLNNLNIPEVVFKNEKSIKCGITGTHLTVEIDGHVEGKHHHDYHHHEHHGHHHHNSMADIEHIISHLNLEESVKEDIVEIYKLIAEAESHAHGMPVSQIHFHEVGTMDAIADISAFCYLLNEIKPDKIIASNIHLGSGTVKCAHGTLPVPAPATAYILKGIPVYSSNIKGELCTPTGAAILKHFVDEFDVMPQMSMEKIGYGMGTKDFEEANCIRAILGETLEKKEIFKEDEIVELSCNMDDMTGEEIGFAMDRLLETGAKEVFTTPVGMKKSRPGILLTVICHKNLVKKIVEKIFKYTTTIGIRQKELTRYILNRQIKSENTKYGEVRYKESSGYGIVKRKFEYDDLAKIAIREGLSIRQVKEMLGEN